MVRQNPYLNVISPLKAFSPASDRSRTSPYRRGSYEPLGAAMRFNLEAMCLKLWPSCTISQPPPPVREVHRLHVLGMDTQHSGALVWEAISSVAGVEDVVVNRRLGQVTVTGTAPIDSIVSAVSGTGKMVCAVSGTSGANGKDDVSDASTHSARRREYDLRASCFCGAVEVAVDSKASPVSTSICHCANCRRISGAPFLANVILSSAAVEVRCEGSGDAGLIDDATSLNTHGVSRRRCAKYAPHCQCAIRIRPPAVLPIRHILGSNSSHPHPMLAQFVAHLFLVQYLTPLRLFSPSNWSHLPYFVPIHRQSNLIANRFFCRYISCTGAFLLFAPLWARSSSSSTRPSSRPRTQSAGRRTTTSGMHTASSTYQIRVSSISTTLGERGVSFLSFFSDKSLKYLHDFGGERCFF